MQFHEKIRTIREQKKLTQEEVAERLNMSISGYSKIERGESQINLQRLDQIAEIFQVNIFDLIPEKNGNLIHHISGGCNSNYQGTFFATPQQHSSEIEKLQLIIHHKDELIAQQAKELESLRSVLQLLKAQTL